jgi:hypothetical protein
MDDIATPVPRITMVRILCGAQVCVTQKAELSLKPRWEIYGVGVKMVSSATVPFSRR